MGYGATRSLERVAAAMGALEAAPIVFEAARDIPQGGVLLALPALLAVGLLRHSTELYGLPKGFYGLSSVLPATPISLLTSGTLLPSSNNACARCFTSAVNTVAERRRGC